MAGVGIAGDGTVVGMDILIMDGMEVMAGAIHHGERVITADLMIMEVTIS